MERVEQPNPTGQADEGHEVLDLDGGRSLLIRPTTADDAGQLDSLYLALEPADLRKRFFTACTPQGDWSRTWASVAERGGYGVIAIVRSDPAAGGDETVVGEAGYALRHDGDGDLAVTVHPDWRGWLGAYLVERLVAHASSTGIANLQADVLLENAAMRRVFEHRGAVAFEHEGETEHVSISTVGHVPSWPPGDRRRRVLVEAAGGRWQGEAAAGESDVAVAVCSGPSRRRRPGCPVLTGGRCPLADGADAIVVLLDPDDDTTPRVIDAHATMNPETPVFVRRADTTPADCRLLSGGFDHDLASILQAASASSDGDLGPWAPPSQGRPMES
jgi:RimJ/RimL family protein N-acetyltransferase